MYSVGTKTVIAVPDRRQSNRAESLITPEMFAEILCDDLDLPVSTFVPAIASSVRQQLDAHAAGDACIADGGADQRAVLKVCV
jgi:SWI/SNF-related matrix-associated actin-dependent regulator of chromatin subfamily B protein 1